MPTNLRTFTIGLIVLSLVLPAPLAWAQAKPVRPAALPALLILSLDSTQPLQMSGKQVIREVFNEKDKIVKVSPGTNERTVLVTGLAVGLSRITFTAADGTVEIVDVIVQVDLDLLKKLLERVVPTAVVTPIAVGNSILLTGTVSRAEDINTIIAITRGFMGGQARVINATQPQRP